MSGTPGKALLVTNIPNPYRIPLFNELHRQLKLDNIDLHVVFGASGYERRQFKLDMNDCQFPHTVLPSKSITFGNSEKVSFTYPGLLSLVKREKPGVVVTNGFSVATLKLWARSWLSAIPYIIWSGAIRFENDADVSGTRKLQRRLVVSRASGFITYGNMARQYLVELGADPGKISVGINTVDTQHFALETQRRRAELDAAPAPGKLLCVTYLTPRKRVHELLHAVALASRTRDDIHLDILGDGLELGNLQQLCEELGIADRVNFPGFVQKQDIPAYMARSAIFLFPTGFDIWGLVLVEAMAAGLPCIASTRAGATRDLVEEGRTGYALDFSDTRKLADRILELASDPGRTQQTGLAAAEKIAAEVSLECSARGFAERIRSCLAESSAGP